MKTYEYILTYNNFLAKYKPIPDVLINSKFILFDIETTGFSREFCKVMLVGFVVFSGKDEHIKVIQYFDDDGLSEKNILDSTVELLKSLNYDYLFTYNGQAFDLPFLNSRSNFLHMNTRFPFSKHVDIYKIIRKYHKEFDLNNYKLKTLEMFLGIDRKDVISGKESVDLYKSFLVKQSAELEESILLHNYDDIVNMLPLLQIFNFGIISLDEFVVSTTNFDKSNNEFFYRSYKYTLNTFHVNKHNQIEISFDSYDILADTLFKNLYFSKGDIQIIDNSIDIKLQLSQSIIDDNELNYINLCDYNITDCDDFLVISINDQLVTDNLIYGFLNLLI